MYIMGISFTFHNSAVTLIKDGQIICAVEEERFNRIKRYSGFPKNSIDYCLKKEGININDIEHIAFYWNPMAGIFKRFSVFLSGFPKSIAFFNKHEIKRGNISTWFEMYRVPKTLKDLYKYKNKFHFVEHHLAHAASCFNISQFNEAAILTIDLAGEATTTFFGKGRENKIEKISEISIPHSLGIFYATVTQYLGFLINSDEYKVMGMAAYGDNKTYYEKVKNLVKLKPSGNFELDLEYFIQHLGRDIIYSKKFVELFGAPREKEAPIEQRHMDIAAAFQLVLEETSQHLVNYLYEKTNVTNLCLAGGVALNGVMNGKFIENGPFKKIFIQPSASDAGCSLGAAYYVYNQLLGYKRNFILEHVYWGPEYSNDEILKAIISKNLEYKKVEEIELETAKLIAEGKVLGWFQGKMEFGPRALGARSILADPRRAEMKDLINKKIKHREEFRPFAPSILENRQSEYFTSNHPSPFMLMVFKIKEEKRNIIPAVTHLDGTGRLQTVNKENNGIYWKLIKEFERITGVPVILNTSFNVAGEPIVCSPQDAINCFLNTDIDFLAIGNFIVNKKI